MEICSRAVVMGLSRLVLRAWPKVFSFAPMLLKNDHELVSPSPMEGATVNGSLELPIDILIDILSMLEIPDLVRAGCVCSSWHTAYTSLRSSGLYKRQQTPWLLYTSESARDNVACMYSLAEERVYKLTLPEPPIRSRYLIGSSNGWLVTADERSELHIVNPITGEQVALPSVITIEHVKPIFDDAGAIQEYELSQYYGEYEIGDPYILPLDNLRDDLYDKAFVFSDSSTRSFIVVLIHNPISQLSFARVGDSKWTWLPPSADYEDCIYLDGILYAVTSTGGIDAFDLTGPTFLRKVIMDSMKCSVYERMYIVQSPLGDLLQVWREQDVIPIVGHEDEDVPERDLLEIERETRKMMLYKVDMAAKNLVQINSLHNHVLFLGYGQSLCMRAEEHPQLKAAHVYMTDALRGIAHWKSNRRDIGAFNMENSTTEEIVPSQCWCTWPAPIWIAPNFAKMSSGLKK
ncbi:hypothetical protein QOZ80_9AG0684720 [Eleusine coracana subsp. coracana]|nr:hypothetical protein QOZ80_9AG0684650 [Eleusine coracana subsp. coracana]KAK3120266.1 hypothetical protein QOZ80_9AG0684720 [Eleusine coracana subsp. coracana]